LLATQQHAAKKYTTSWYANHNLILIRLLLLLELKFVVVGLEVVLLRGIPVTANLQGFHLIELVINIQEVVFCIFV